MNSEKVGVQGIIDFIKHLRLNYQFFILSGPFLLGGLLSPRTDLEEFIVQFLSVYVCLFGGVTAYNSFWDKDDGPIGGLEHPPRMDRWMLYTAWAVQLIGLLIALRAGFYFSALYVSGMIFSVLYSSPLYRWKTKPFRSFIATGVGVVMIPTFMGFIAYGGTQINMFIISGAIGSALLVLSLYPFSQVYQMENDKKKGDITFAVKYGLEGVRKSYVYLYFPGITFISLSLLRLGERISLTAMFLGICAGFIIYARLKESKSGVNEYKKIMKTKYFLGVVFSVFVFVLSLLF